MTKTKALQSADENALRAALEAKHRELRIRRTLVDMSAIAHRSEFHDGKPWTAYRNTRDDAVRTAIAWHRSGVGICKPPKPF